MRLFLSYARVDKPYAIQVVNMLDIHEIWYDQRLYAGQDWWREILRRLDWCDGFVYLLSPDSVASEYCRKEAELAKMLRRPIFPIIVRDHTLIPDTMNDIKELQYVDLSKGIDPDTVKVLLNSIYLAERAQQKVRPMSVETIGSSNDVMMLPPANSAMVIKLAAEAMANGSYDQAVLLLKQAKANGYKSTYINIEAILKEAEAALARQTMQVEVEREYRQIVELVKVPATRMLGLEAFKAFHVDFPAHDPDNMAQYLSAAEAAALAQPVKSNGTALAEYPSFVLPLLEWAEVATGNVDVCYTAANSSQQKKRINVPKFLISRYPVTNAQYQAFIDDDDGYRNTEWWEFSAAALASRLKHPEAIPSRFKGPERPREMVSWYDAMAYCNWLSTRLDTTITLPTAAQWQRALQGDEGRIYPWGNRFEADRCNSAESGVKMTTIVTRYPQGASTFGVYDMAGNVWEWCLDGSPNADSKASAADQEKRVVRGGSFMSSHQRALVDFHYDLNPESYHASIGFRLVQNV